MKLKNIDALNHALIEQINILKSDLLKRDELLIEISDLMPDATMKDLKDRITTLCKASHLNN